MTSIYIIPKWHTICGTWDGRMTVIVRESNGVVVAVWADGFRGTTFNPNQYNAIGPIQMYKIEKLIWRID